MPIESDRRSRSRAALKPSASPTIRRDHGLSALIQRDIEASSLSLSSIGSPLVLLFAHDNANIELPELRILSNIHVQPAIHLSNDAVLSKNVLIDVLL